MPLLDMVCVHIASAASTLLWFLALCIHIHLPLTTLGATRSPCVGATRAIVSREARGDLVKNVSHIRVDFCTCLPENSPNLVCIFGCHLRIHFTLVLQVAFVPRHSDDDIWRTHCSELFHPLLQFPERRLFGDVVNNDGSSSPAIVHGSQGVILLLPCSVPNEVLVAFVAGPSQSFGH